MRSSHIIYVDESGSSDFGAGNVNYPVFVLAFCVFRVETYIHEIDPLFRGLKFEYFGHDLVILHESDIRKKVGAFKALNDPLFREEFLNDLSSAISKSDFKILPIVRTKPGTQTNGSDNYTTSAVDGLNQCIDWLKANGFEGEELVFAFESRGPKDDQRLLEALETIFWHHRDPLISVKFVPKAFASTGLQIADLVARPIGLNEIRPDQPNRSYEMIREKLVS